MQKSLPGGHSVLEPPDPISNSDVKRLSADDSVGFPHAKVGHCQALIRTPSLSGLGVFFACREALCAMTEVVVAVPGATSVFFPGPSPDLGRCVFLLRLRDQGTPSVAYPLDGVAIGWMASYFRLTPVRAFAGRSCRMDKGYRSICRSPLAGERDWRVAVRPQAGSYKVQKCRAGWRPSADSLV